MRNWGGSRTCYRISDWVAAKRSEVAPYVSYVSWTIETASYQLSGRSSSADFTKRSNSARYTGGSNRRRWTTSAICGGVATRNASPKWYRSFWRFATNLSVTQPANDA